MMLQNHKRSAQKANKLSQKSKQQFVIPKQYALFIIVACLLLLNLALLGAMFKISSVRKQGATVAVVGEQKTQNGITVQTSSLKTETGYIMGIKPDIDKKIMSFTIKITNNSGKSFDFYPATQTFVRDNQGGTYTMVPVALIGPFQATTIMSGESKEGQLAYMVPNREIPLSLYVESRQDGAMPFVISLQ